MDGLLGLAVLMCLGSLPVLCVSTFHLIVYARLGKPLPVYWKLWASFSAVPFSCVLLIAQGVNPYLLGALAPVSIGMCVSVLILLLRRSKIQSEVHRELEKDTFDTSAVYDYDLTVTQRIIKAFAEHHGYSLRTNRSQEDTQIRSFKKWSAIPFFFGLFLVVPANVPPGPADSDLYMFFVSMMASGFVFSFFMMKHASTFVKEVRHEALTLEELDYTKALLPKPLYESYANLKSAAENRPGKKPSNM